MKYILTGFICIGIGFLIGNIATSIPHATIIVSNSSSKVIQYVYLTVETNADSTTYFLDDIEQGQSKTVKIFVTGEAGYKIKVDFTKGDSLVSGNYIEAGYKINEIVSDTSIVPNFEQY